MTAFFIYLSWLNPNLRPPYYPPNQPWISGNLFISLVHPDQSELKTRYMLELTILSHLLQCTDCIKCNAKNRFTKKTSKSIWFLHKTSILTVLESQTKNPNSKPVCDQPPKNGPKMCNENFLETNKLFFLIQNSARISPISSVFLLAEYWIMSWPIFIGHNNDAGTFTETQNWFIYLALNKIL